jgi:molybdopterin-containing oxidoreductase family iron-sulfur binding subunit
VFGDVNDPDSDVSRLRRHDLAYHVLEDLNVKPNVTYVARLRNTRSENRG